MKSSKTRGPSKTPPAYRKHRRSGQAIVTLSGKDHYLGPHGTKVRERQRPSVGWIEIESEMSRIICLHRLG